MIKIHPSVTMYIITDPYYRGALLMMEGDGTGNIYMDNQWCMSVTSEEVRNMHHVKEDGERGIRLATKEEIQQHLPKSEYDL